MNTNKHVLGSLILLLFLLFAPLLKAVELGQVTYETEMDKKIQLEKVSLLPGFDNMNQVYSKSLTETLRKTLAQEHRFNLVEKESSLSFPADEYFKVQKELQAFFKDSPFDFAFQITIVRQTKGLSLILTLFWKEDAAPLAQESIRDLQIFDTASLEKELLTLYRSLLKKFPFDGHILSRNNERVTINLGSSDGVKEGQSMSVVEILTLNRHPKLHFAVSSSQRVIGTIRVYKAEEKISFANVIAEVRPHAITKRSKVSGLSQVEYQDWAKDPKEDSQSLSEKDKVAFGQKALAWLPEQRPTFGSVGARFGIGTFSEKLSVDQLSLDSGRHLYPQVTLLGELWINPRWITRARLVQGFGSFANPRSGSGPSQLSLATSRYDLGINFRHNFLNDFMGPHFELGLGLTQSIFRVDNSNPVGLTSVTFKNLFISLGGEFPLFPESPYSLGGRVYLHIQPSVSESPVSSGTAQSNQHSEFIFYGSYMAKQNLKFVGSADFNLYSARFTGSGSQGRTGETLSIQDTTLNFGADYMF